ISSSEARRILLQRSGNAQQKPELRNDLSVDSAYIFRESVLSLFDARLPGDRNCKSCTGSIRAIVQYCQPQKGCCLRLETSSKPHLLVANKLDHRCVNPTCNP